MTSLQFTKIPPNVLEHYRNIDRHRAILERTKISLIKAVRVLPQTLTRTLDFMASRQGYSKNFENELIIFKITAEDDARTNSQIRLFSFFTEAIDEQNRREGGTKSTPSSLGIISGAARKVVDVTGNGNGTELVDYYLAEYFFAPGEESQTRGSLLAAIGFGGVAVFSVVTGGVGGVVVGVVSTVGSVLFAGHAIVESGKEGRAEVAGGNVKDILQACFIYELVSQGHAKLENNQMVFIEM